MTPICRKCGEPILEKQMFYAERDTEQNVWTPIHEGCKRPDSLTGTGKLYKMTTARAWVLMKEVEAIA